MITWTNLYTPFGVKVTHVAFIRDGLWRVWDLKTREDVLVIPDSTPDPWVTAKWHTAWLNAGFSLDAVEVGRG